MEDELHPHLQYVSQLSCEVVFIVLVLQLNQILGLVEGHAADLQVVRPRGEGLLLAHVQVADALSLVDLEVAFVIPVVDAVAHVFAERGQGRGELQDVVAVTQVADVEVELQGVLDVQAGQTHHLLSQLQGENSQIEFTEEKRQDLLCKAIVGVSNMSARAKLITWLSSIGSSCVELVLRRLRPFLG